MSPTIEERELIKASRIIQKILDLGELRNDVSMLVNYARKKNGGCLQSPTRELINEAGISKDTALTFVLKELSDYYELKEKQQK